MVDRVEDQFDAVGDAQLVEDAKEILLDGVLAEAQLSGNIAVAEPFGDSATTCSSRGVSRVRPHWLMTRRDGT